MRCSRRRWRKAQVERLLRADQRDDDAGDHAFFHRGTRGVQVGLRRGPTSDHSIVYGTCKPLSRKEDVSATTTFTVRFTVKLIWSPRIAFSIYRHLSRTIGARAWATFRDVSRSIAFSSASLTASTRPSVVRDGARHAATIKRPNLLSTNAFRRLFLPSCTIADAVRQA